MSLGQVTYCLSKARYETQMIWEQPYETNLDRLRRYAAFACGSQGLGDGVLSEALEDVLDEVSSARSTNLVLLFEILDATLRKTPPGAESLFEGLGRWQKLSPLERRVILLCLLEEFDFREVARITCLGRGDVKAIFGRARMLYADRFPARIGLVGGSEADRAAIEAAAQTCGYRLLWTAEPDGDATLDGLPPASLVLVAHDGTDPEQGLSLCRGYDGPVVLAHKGAENVRLNARHWTLPPAGLKDATLLNSVLIRALLFSD